jgi:tetratricopeptide (TPR) repeat protein
MVSPVVPNFSPDADPADKAAFIAESVLEDLPSEVALTARRCVILHWFDQPVVTALAPDVNVEQAADIFQQLTALSFIEPVQGGFAYHALTREGLLRLYTTTHTDWVIAGARLAAPIFAARTDSDKAAAETFYCAIIAGEVETAERLLQNALDTLPARDEWAGLGYWFNLQDEAEAVPGVQPLMRNSLQCMGRGVVHYFEKNLTTAIADFSHTLEFDPNDAHAYNNRGTTYDTLKNYAAALADYTRAIELDPNYAQAFSNRGNTYHQQKAYAAALADYTRAIELDPNLAQAFSNRGLTYHQQKAYAAALADYTRAIELDPNDAQIYNNRGVAFAYSEDHRSALADYAQAMKLDPSNDSPVYNTACAYALQNEVTQACVWLRKAIVMSDKYIGMAQTDTDFDAIRDTPEFQALMQEFGNKPA